LFCGIYSLLPETSYGLPIINSVQTHSLLAHADLIILPIWKIFIVYTRIIGT